MDTEARVAPSGSRLDAWEALRLLAAASDVLAASLDLDATLQSVAHLSVPGFADWCTVRLLEPDGRIRHAAAAHRDPAMERRAWELAELYPVDPAGPVGVARAIRTGEPQLDATLTLETIEALARDKEHRRRVRELAPRSRIVVPLKARGRVLGALSFMLVEGRGYTPEDLLLAEELGRRCALAIDNARLYHEAQSAVALRDQFISIAAHELRTPLTTIRGYAQLLHVQHERDGRPERELRALAAMVRAVDRLSALSRDLLDVSRIRTGQFALELRPLDLAALAREVVERHADTLDGQAPSRLRIEVVAAPLPVLCDAERLEQVLSNLIENALKYSPDGGEVVVELRREDGRAELSVRDHGIGVPADALERIFELFGRAPNAAENAVTGLGLGLYICRSIVEGHGGRVWVESAGVGRGATFRVELPLAEGAASAA